VAAAATADLPGGDLPDADEGGDERWPMIVAIALGVMLAGFVSVQLLRRGEAERDFASAPPTTIAAAAAPSPTVPPPAPPAAPERTVSDTPHTPAAAPVVTPAAPIPAGARTADAAPSAMDALDTVDDFRRAYEQRNVERLGALFAIDARKGDLTGRDVVIADYQRFFANARDLLYSQPSAAVEPHGDHVIVRAPFEITYKDANDRVIEVRGTAAWTLVRRDGATLIRNLDFEITPVAAAGR
jgi:hypothetical protein